MFRDTDNSNDSALCQRRWGVSGKEVVSSSGKIPMKLANLREKRSCAQRFPNQIYYKEEYSL